MTQPATQRDVWLSRYTHAQNLGASGDPAGAAAELEALAFEMSQVVPPNHPDMLAVHSSLAGWRGAVGVPAGAADAAGSPVGPVGGPAGAHEAGQGAAGPGAQHDTRPDGTCAICGRMKERRQAATERLFSGDAAGALPELEQLVAEYHEAMGPGDVETLGTRLALARCCHRLGDLSRALEELSSAHTVALLTLGAEHPLTAEIEHDLAELRVEAGSEVSAEAQRNQMAGLFMMAGMPLAPTGPAANSAPSSRMGPERLAEALARNGLNVDRTADDRLVGSWDGHPVEFVFVAEPWETLLVRAQWGHTLAVGRWNEALVAANTHNSGCLIPKLHVASAQGELYLLAEHPMNCEQELTDEQLLMQVNHVIEASLSAFRILDGRFPETAPA